ncbi:tetratricopeptide repeat protein [Pontibacter mucosus]|uniref:Tetratricopeptide repeat protein n=1 Tax=Pontibacter mucosus TaxID=1649266 RepID=A0A2T5YHQ9_9BACT|nr:tetratricopeptide repeat protein [Pontibacter mucosus]PTX18839.1 tetratricopeptide repeat protein [Pontibacter mucosus]
MKGMTLAAILLVSLFSGGISVVTRINQHTQEAAIAYKRQDFIEAIASYNYLLEDLNVDDDQLRLNLAHSYYQAGLLPQATAAYQYLADHPQPRLRALAHLQLGNIYTRQKKYKRALALYKQALVTEPGNEAARYNFELLKKYLLLNPEAGIEDEPAEDKVGSMEQKPEPPATADSPKPRQNPDAQCDQQEEIDTPEPDQNGQEQQPAGSHELPEGEKEREEATGEEEGDEQGQKQDNPFDKNGQQHKGSAEGISAEDEMAQTRRARLRQANMSPEKARLLLDAMRNAEMQYIQQLPKQSTRQPDRSKPDW